MAMELQRVAQSVLRAKCLIPETCGRALRNIPQWRRDSMQHTTRSFTTSRDRNAQSAAQALAPEREELPDAKTSFPQPQRALDPSASRPASQLTPRRANITSVDDNHTSNSNSTPPRPFIRRESLARSPYSPQDRSSKPVLRTKAFSALEDWNRSRQPSKSSYGDVWSPPPVQGSAPNPPGRGIVDNFRFNLPNPSQARTGAFDKPLEEESEQPMTYPELNARLGRTVEVSKAGLAAAMNRLNSVVASNGVLRDFNAQKFHERPGLKRKRLASQRWRRRFKAGFVQTIKRVQKFSKQGW